MLIIPLNIDGQTNPYGFASVWQGKVFRPDSFLFSVDEYEDLLITPIIENFPAFMDSCITGLKSIRNYRSAERALKRIINMSSLLTEKQINKIIELSSKNDQITHAALCAKEYLPALLKIGKHDTSNDYYKDFITSLNIYRQSMGLSIY